MAFKLSGWSAFTSKEERKIRKAKKKILKAGSKKESGPGFYNEDGEWVEDGSYFGRKGKKAAKKLKKAGYTEEQIEEATGAEGWSKAMDWAADPAVTKKDKK
tara:strand:- start:93 stop:398 length:306 start_codon:yes stop_codon:yes gene_type:complete